tara:strand:+ start:2482 stop:4383 length:1902 start_codon:yes stop_codon:yes gene_type:complete
MANIKIRNLNPGSYEQITSGSFLATALNENEGTNEKLTVRATAEQIVSGGAVYADFSEHLLVSGVPVSTGSTTVGGKTIINEGAGGSIDFGDTNSNLNIESPSIFKESVTINKTLDVTEAATFNSTSLFKGDSTFESNTTFGTNATDTSIFNSTSTFKENSSFKKDVSIDGDLTIGGSKALALDYSATNNDKVLKVVGGALSWETDNAGLSSVDWNQVNNKPTTFAPSSHNHSWSNITDAPAVSSSNNGQVLKIVNGALAWATDDSGLSSVDWSDVNNKPATFAPSTHTHAIADITSLQTSLDGKAASSHSHIWSDITSTPTTLAGYGITDAQPASQMSNYITASAYSAKFGSSPSWDTIAWGRFLSKNNTNSNANGSGKMAVQANDGSGQGSTFGLISDNTGTNDKFVTIYLRDNSKAWNAVNSSQKKRMGINMGMSGGNFNIGWIGSVPAGDPYDNINILDSSRDATTGAVTTHFEGTVTGGAKSFKINHPIKPDTHWLYHCSIEGPEANTLYKGKVTLVNGSAEINIDSACNMTEGTFVALNTNNQCFTNNESNWDLVRGSINGNILTIESQNSDSTAEVSWMVIGERHDDFMKNNNIHADSNGKIITEIEKTEKEKNPSDYINNIEDID